ncbi:glucose 1-dehydrogenase [Bacillus sp. HMF5848]|nr:glucose 1-dehydrogenase [Bacillus sp. HMF5848]RSK26743.1 glucose 1-dehydrogenase [Bacillus sp. HMF5848]
MFHGLTVIVTGAANGIGKEIAVAYVRAGANVVIADVDEQKGKQLTKELASKNVVFIKTDVKLPNDINNLMEQAKELFGTIHILINNAGVSRWKHPYDLTVEEWDDILNTNLRSVFLASREAAKHMEKNEKGGSIINIASTRAIMSEKNTEAYAASKGGIVSLTHALAISFGEKRIKVNAISPGWIEVGDYSKLRHVDHSQHPAQRVGQPSDIAKACLYLTAPDNNFITGTNLVIDGGMTKKMIYEE